MNTTSQESSASASLMMLCAQKNDLQIILRKLLNVLKYLAFDDNIFGENKLDTQRKCFDSL